jgi:ABC-type nitrate/sulfonate/bicarbonate transport system permease component
MLEVIKMFAGVFLMGGIAFLIFAIAFILEEVEYRQMQERRGERG